MKHRLIIRILLAFSLSLMIGVDANALGPTGIGHRMAASSGAGITFQQMSAVKQIRRQSSGIGLQILNNGSSLNGTANLASPLSATEFFSLSANQKHLQHRAAVTPPLANKQVLPTLEQSHGAVYFTQVMNNDAYGVQKTSFLNGTVSP